MSGISKLSLFICLLFLIFSNQNAYSIDREKILYFNDIDGLPRNIVTNIEQDKYGYTWIGTGSGIARFDGHAFHQYKELEGVNILNLLIDPQNRLWVTCDLGLYGYNRLKDEFEIIWEGYARKTMTQNKLVYLATGENIHIIENTKVTNTIKSIGIVDFCITNDGIWISKNKDGIFFYSKESDYKNITRKYLEGRMVSLVRKIENNLFFACRNGDLYVLKNNKFFSKVNIGVYPSIMEIIKVDHQIWVATDGEGILILDSDANLVSSIRKNSNQSSALNNNSIYDIYLGNNNEVWVGTYSGGLICLQATNSPFKNIVPEARNRNSLIDQEGTAVLKKDNKLYLGTNYGLSVLDETTGMFTNYNMQTMKKKLNGVKILAINSDSLDNIWIATYGGLLGKFTPDMKLIESFHPCGDNPHEMQRIAILYNHNNTNLLIGTHYWSRSLLNFDLKTGKATPFQVVQRGKNTTNFRLTSIRKNRNGDVLALIGTNGLFTLDVENNQIHNRLNEINKRITFRLNDFYHDNKDCYWFATQKDGLVRMSKDGLLFDKWGTEQGLPSSTLLRLESVDDKFLWISSISGLCRFDMETEQILVFNHRHDLPANEFMQRTSIITNDGRIIFGSNAGFTIIDPDKVQTDISKSEVIISDIQFQNQSIKHVPDKNYLNKPLEETEFIKLPFSKNSFTIHFFSKDQELPQYNNYAYRLIGLENDWIYLGDNKQTTYTNLSPGTYTFEVKSTNKSNIWNDTPTQLRIKITPPWYLTWYAFVSYMVIVTVVLFTFFYFYTYRIQLKKEVEMSEYKVEQEHELTENKLAFFTNISHDLKTPLTLIDAPVNELLDSNDFSDNNRNKLLIIKRNSQRLYNLISDILDFRKLTQKQLPLIVRESKIDQVIENVYEAFKAECAKKQIDLNTSITIDEPVFVEVKKIEKILWNLTSNAIKFTEAEGEIYLSADKVKYENSNFLKLMVRDSGIGISNEDKSNIFNRFYQNKEDSKRSSVGAGIGLSIVKELIELHHGTVEVDSKVGVGTTLTVLIPVDRDEYSEDEMATDHSKIKEQIEPTKENINEDSVSTIQENNNYNLPVLLLVEDNVELREYMAGYFGKKYKVFHASDGVEGIEMVKRKKPDIIITDVLMPNMDGHEFCKTIRSNFDTSHLPILMLTANSMIEQQIEGLSVGADAYVIKPFDIKYLDTLIQSTLENRKKIRTRIMGKNENGKCENTLTERDIEFVDELRQCINNNISNINLNVDLLSEHFAISRTQLNRKIKSLTGQTPNNLIKSMRLKTAYELIREKGFRVAEAAYQTGFSDPNYFTICFKKEFGENPSKV